MPKINMTDRWLKSRRCAVLQPKIKRKRKPGRENTRAVQTTYFDKGMPGLILIVGAEKKTWRVVHYVRGRARTHKLGRHPPLSLAEARVEARKFLANPRAALARSEAGSFKDVATDFIKRHVEANKLRSKSEIERCLEVYIYPRWKDHLFIEVKRGDVTKLLDEVEDKNGPRQADMVLAIVRKLMNWYATRVDDYLPPIVRGMGRANPKDRARTRILSDDEIRSVWKAAEGTYGALIKVALLTAQRQAKIATMKWADVVEGVWTIATAPREKSTAGALKLPQAVLDIINAQPRVAENPHVFVGVHGKSGHFNSFSQRKQELDDKLPDVPAWVFHDLRRTARSLMSRAGVRPDISERVLGHAIVGVEGVYDRHQYLQEKAEALKQLSALVETITNPPKGNVVAMTGRRKKAR